MAKRMFQALGIALAVSLVAFAGFTAGATGQGSGADSGEGDVSLWQRLHSIGDRLHSHGGAHGHQGADGDFAHHMGELVSQLNLSQEQAERLEAIHQAFASQGDRAHGSMVELHERLVEQFEQGTIDSGAVHPMIERHLAEMRTVAYSVTDELVALANSLDAGQREIVLAHLRAAQGDKGHHRRGL